MKNKKEFSKYDLFTTIVVSVIGAGVFSYSKELASYVGVSGWIVTIISGILSFIALYMIYLIVKLNNYEKFDVIIENTFGKIIGKLVIIQFCVYIIFSTSIQVRDFVEIIKMYLLEKTPLEFILIVIILCGIYLIRGELESLIKFNQIALWIMIIPIVIMIPFVLKDSDFSRMLPLVDFEKTKYLPAIKGTLYTFSGFEIAYIILPFMKKKDQIPKTIFKSMSFITLFYLISFVVTIIFFTKGEVSKLLWPAITMVECIDIPGAFIERWEGIIMSIWIIFNFTAFVNATYLGSHIIKDSFKLRDVKISMIFILPIVYLMALYPSNVLEVNKLEDAILPIFLVINYVILPLCVLLKYYVKGGVANET